ncbi:MAG: guanylate kinase [Clostridiales bacterium]|nr:guanylate kinase [Clostridiales bacterium]
MSGLLIVIAGPSGAGKGTIYNSLLERLPNTIASISATTRKPRGVEQDGVHYFFKTVSEFESMIERDELLEYADVFGNYYGTPKKFVMDSIQSGKNVILEIDVVGAAQIKRKFPSCIMMFIMPPSFEVLEKRLRGRATDSEESIVRRLSEAKRELSTYEMFDYIVFNDDLQQAISQAEAIICAERNKISRNESKIKQLLNE